MCARSARTCRDVKRETEPAAAADDAPAADAGPSRDFSLKEGETIKITTKALKACALSFGPCLRAVSVLHMDWFAICPSTRSCEVVCALTTAISDSPCCARAFACVRRSRPHP